MDNPNLVVPLTLCPHHPPKTAIGFCCDCRAVLCPRCLRHHIGHKLESLDDICKRNENLVTDLSLPDTLISLLERKRECLCTRRDMISRQKENMIRKLAPEDETFKNINDAFEEEYHRLEAIQRYLINAGDSAVTDLVRKTCEKAINSFELEDKLKVELLSPKEKVEKNRKKMKDIDVEIMCQNVDISILEHVIKAAKDGHFNEEEKLAYILLNEKTDWCKPIDDEDYCINTAVDDFVAFPTVNMVFDIEGILKKKLVNVGKGVKISKPIEVEKKLIVGSDLYVSLSHRGVLAIYSHDEYVIQFTDLNTNNQKEMKVENYSLAAFYDDKILLLTWDKPLRESTVKSVFSNPSISIFEEIEETNDISPYTDASIINVTRKLYYWTISDEKLFMFNVDTRENEEIPIDKNCYVVGSLTGINCGGEIVFYNHKDRYSYALKTDNSTERIGIRQNEWLVTVFPSSSNPDDFENAVLKYSKRLIKDGKEISSRQDIEFCGGCSIVRIYKDVFLAYDENMDSWVLTRILVP